MSENKTIEFPSGMYVNRPSDSNKHFLFGKIDITRKELGNWLRSKQEDKIQIDILLSKNKVDDFGNPKLYLAVDDGSWRTQNTNVETTQNTTLKSTIVDEEFSDDIPF